MVRMCRKGNDPQFTDVCRAWLTDMLAMSEQGNLTYGNPEAFREALADLPLSEKRHLGHVEMTIDQIRDWPEYQKLLG